MSESNDAVSSPQALAPQELTTNGAMDVRVSIESPAAATPQSESPSHVIPTSPSSSSPSNAKGSRALFKDLIINLMTSVHLPNILQGTSQGIRSALIPIFGRSLGASDATVGLITALAGLARILIGFPAGQYTSKHGFVRTMIIGMIVNIGAALIAFIAWNEILLGAASFFFGAGIGIFFTSRTVMLSHIIDRSRRGRLMSMVGGGERWSNVIGPVTGGLLIDYFGNRVCALAIIPVAVACIACTMKSSRMHILDERILMQSRIDAALEYDALHGETEPIAPNDSGNSPQKTDKNRFAPQGRDLATLLREYGHLIVSVGVYSMNIIQMRACRKLMLPLAALNLGLSPTLVGLVLTVSFVIDATLFFLGGLVMDKFGRKFAAIPTAANLGIGFLLLAHSNGAISLFAVAVFFGFADSLGAGLLLTLNADHAPKKGGPEFMGLMRVIQDTGQMLGPLLAGWLTSTFSFYWACMFFAVLGFFDMIWAILMLPKEASDLDPPPPSSAH